MGQTVDYFEELGSTNSYIKQLPGSAVTHGQLCLTDHQYKGRGQYERNWESGNGKNLTFTLAFHPSRTDRFHILTLACARAIVEEIVCHTSCNALIKWPNDILINGCKLTGILTETVYNGNTLDRLLVGIGINVNQDQFTEAVAQKATSLKLETGTEIDREQFLCGIISRIEYQYRRWHKQNNELLKWINPKIIGYGQWVNLRVNDEVLNDTYKLLGVDQQGKLAVVTDEGDLKTFSYEQVRVITD